MTIIHSAVKKGVLILILLLGYFGHHTIKGLRWPVPSIQKFMKQRLGEPVDGFKVQWTQLVSAKRKIRKIKKEGVTMVQGAVILHATRDVPMMTYNNLKDKTDLRSWLEAVGASGNGMKLHLLYTNTVTKAISSCFGFKSALKGPIWFHADILPGPNSELNALRPVDPKKYVETCKTQFPDATVSVGWITQVPKYTGHIIDTRYTWTHLLEMINWIYPLEQNVNIVFRVVYLQYMSNELLWLLSLSPNISITLWAYGPDYVSLDHFASLEMNAMIRLRTYGDKSRVFYDIGPWKSDFLSYHGMTWREKRYGVHGTNWNSSQWRVIDFQSSSSSLSRCLTNEFGAIFIGGANDILRSGKHYQASNTSDPIPAQTISGHVLFVPRLDVEESESEDEVRFLIHLRPSIERLPSSDVDEAITIRLDMAGKMLIVDNRNKSEPKYQRPRVSAQTAKFPCYHFKVHDYFDLVEFETMTSTECTGFVYPTKCQDSPGIRQRISLSVPSLPASVTYKKSVKKRSANYVLVQKGKGRKADLIIEHLSHSKGGVGCVFQFNSSNLFPFLIALVLTTLNQI